MNIVELLGTKIKISVIKFCIYKCVQHHIASRVQIASPSYDVNATRTT